MGHFEDPDLTLEESTVAFQQKTLKIFQVTRLKLSPPWLWDQIENR